MSDTITTLADALQEALDQALDSYKSNSDNAISKGFDGGRIDGLRQALEIVEKYSGTWK